MGKFNNGLFLCGIKFLMISAIVVALIIRDKLCDNQEFPKKRNFKYELVLPVYRVAQKLQFVVLCLFVRQCVASYIP